ncbi:MAG: hypothetical protein K0U59_07915 [Gammaproteobacteria bacterium]|nr:hypothetical protein [Gammaproteobacteria bacterium]
MKEIRAVITISILFTMLGGCASYYETLVAKYTPPAKQIYSREHNSTKEQMLVKAKRALLLEGFQVLSTDDEAGYVSTALKNWKLTEVQAYCEPFYLGFAYTKTEVAFNVVVDDSTIVIRSNVQGKHRKETLTCVSRGLIEASLANKIFS